MASLAPLLLSALKGGDEAAKAIESKAARELSALVIAVWQKSGMVDGELALTGSILQRFPGIRQRVISTLDAAFPALRIGDPLGTPAEGAANLAIALFSCPDKTKKG